MPKLIIGIFILCSGLAIMTVGGYMAKDGWEALKKSNLLGVLLRISIGGDKLLELRNDGDPLENINVFATQYVLKDFSISDPKIEIENYSKIGGAIKTIPLLNTKESKKIDLTSLASLSFYETPGNTGNARPSLTYYCFRITHTDSRTKNVGVSYKTTWSCKNYPSVIENQERTATAGGTLLDCMHDIPDILEAHQKKIFGDK